LHDANCYTRRAWSQIVATEGRRVSVGAIEASERDTSITCVHHAGVVNADYALDGYVPNDYARGESAHDGRGLLPRLERRHCRPNLTTPPARVDVHAEATRARKLAHGVSNFALSQSELFTETREAERTFALLGKVASEETRQGRDARIAEEVQ
jgi:hypothetical protein